MSGMRSAARLMQTVRHLRGEQIANRLVRSVRRPRARRLDAPGFRPTTGSWVAPVVRPSALTSDLAFTALNETHSLAVADGWTAAGASRLWRYHAHYFDDLNAEDAAAKRTTLEALIARWIVEHPAAADPGWEPYPLSRRIVNWSKWHLAGGRLDATARASLATQADLLSRSLEFHLLGNHLLANAKALLFAGATLDGSAATGWLRAGRRLLERELDEQVLPDGAHCELSPMYHALVAEDVLDLINLQRATDVELPELSTTARRMLEWLAAMTHPDRAIALFNDAAFDGGPGPAELEAYAQRLGIATAVPPPAGLTWLSASGYGRLALGPAVLLADAGALGPDYQPGHAHADTLSFELSVYGLRVIVDSGTSTYAVGPERDDQRGTRAHNTVCLDGRNSSDVWSAFRVGRRARVSDVRLNETADRLELGASHDGYAYGREPVMHHRDWSLCEDSLTIRDRLTGRGTHDIEAALHFHPDVSVRPVGPSAFEARLPGADLLVRIETAPEARSTVEPTSYHPCFGVALANSKLVSRTRDPLPCSLETRIVWVNGGRVAPERNS
jgi:uncharacterized heparinase superfamily protein